MSTPTTRNRRTRQAAADYLDHFRARVLQDALNEATAAYWQHRADALDNARSRPGDRPGTHTTPEALMARDRALSEDADECRLLARLAPVHTAPRREVCAVLADTAWTDPDLPDAA